jgi:AraC family transcriptional regulator, arabinose operon regulatory protein
MDMIGHSLSVIAVDYARHTKPFINDKSSLNRHCYLVRLQIKGKCRVSIRGKEYDLGPGDMVFSIPNQGYVLDIGGVDQPIDSADYYLICDGPWIKQWWEESSLPDVANIELDEGLLFIWRKLIMEKRNVHENNSEMLETLLKLFFLSLGRLLKDSKAISPRSRTYISYQIKTYIERHATKPLTLPHIAAHHNVSVSTASQLFKQSFGQTIMSYVLEVRLSIATQRIMIGGMKLEDIAEYAGFQSYPYFCRTFRTRYGVSPSQFRGHDPYNRS